MAELDHYWGEDLAVSPTGDLALAAGTPAGVQRVLRRLLTGTREYLWHPAYGAGLPGRVGSVLDPPRLTALIRAQMRRERAVAPSPVPQVTLTPIASGVSVQIRYADRASGTAVATPAFDVTA